MTQGKIIMAIKTLDKMKSQPMPLPLSYKLYKLRKTLQPHWDWQVEQEMKILEEKGVQTENGLTITQEERAEFDSALLAIIEIEVEKDWTPVKVSVSDGLTISIEDIEALDGFVEIEIGDDNE